MASVFGHVVSAFGVGSLFPKKEMTPKVYLLGSVSAALPDIDVLSTYFGLSGLDMLGHRGITHSITAALIWALVIVFIFHKKDKKTNLLLLYYFICTASHGLIDGMTNGGDGISYFAPFSSYRTHLPFELIQVSPLGMNAFFSEWGLKVIKSELIWIGIPSLLLIVSSKIFNLKR